MNKPHVGPLDPKPGAPEALKQPTRLTRIVIDGEWTEYEFPSMQAANHGILGETHPDLR
jgi:hypothetical protein